MSNDVSVIGLYILDVLGRPVERIPERGNVEFIDEIRLTVAGTAGGTVVDLAKLGLKALAVGAVGEDEKADFVIDRLERHGVDASGMQRLSGVPTSATILNVRPNGERPALHVRGASDHFDVAREDWDRVLAPPIVHLGGTGLLRRMDGEPSRVLLEEAKRRGRTTTFDLIAANEETIALVEPLLPFIDYFMPSIEEARIMSGCDTVEDCAKFYLDRGVATCVLTLGGEGAYYAGRDGTAFRRPAYRVEVVDTTGCGDAFDAGFIAALHHGMDPETAVGFAQAAAGLVATGLGSDAGIRSFEHTLDCMSTWPRPA
ncbi:carbohydrate kinase family protein [Rubellimicrobium roseum]|uniref:Sugar kinase n=1 Tax=Rubellimicrobium roseum TaxID=687525 RepID=A0A5C4N9B1_9RHOB|nr:sugar kinase [Rubellimicrobium roseum]TNC63210.1 sugar kinase [Rubellimicrobium roseum]